MQHETHGFLGQVRSGHADVMGKFRLLDLVKPCMCVLPEVSTPDRRRGMWNPRFQASEYEYRIMAMKDIQNYDLLQVVVLTCFLFSGSPSARRSCGREFPCSSFWSVARFRCLAILEAKTCLHGVELHEALWDFRKQVHGSELGFGLSCGVEILFECCCERILSTGCG